MAQGGGGRSAARQSAPYGSPASYIGGDIERSDRGIMREMAPKSDRGGPAERLQYRAAALASGPLGFYV
jgi:hypothetical protein